MNKPEPPDDLWQQIDCIRKELQKPRPANSFTIKEFCAKYEISYSTARDHIRVMLQAGKIQKHRIDGKSCYTLVPKTDMIVLKK